METSIKRFFNLRFWRSLWLAIRLKWNGSPKKLKSAIKKADKLYEKNKLRYRVYFVGGKYRAFARQEIQRKKHSGEWNRNVNVTKMQHMAFYDTLTGISEMGQKALTIRDPYQH